MSDAPLRSAAMAAPATTSVTLEVNGQSRTLTIAPWTTLLDALHRTQENVSLTAQELGVSRVTLYRMLRRHAISLSRGLKDPPVPGYRVGSDGSVTTR